MARTADDVNCRDSRDSKPIKRKADDIASSESEISESEEEVVVSPIQGYLVAHKGCGATADEESVTTEEYLPPKGESVSSQDEHVPHKDTDIVVEKSCDVFDNFDDDEGVGLKKSKRTTDKPNNVDLATPPSDSAVDNCTQTNSATTKSVKNKTSKTKTPKTTNPNTATDTTTPPKKKAVKAARMQAPPMDDANMAGSSKPAGKPPSAIKRTKTTAAKTKDTTKSAAKKVKLLDSKTVGDVENESGSGKSYFDVMPGFEKCGPTFHIFLAELARINKLAAQGKPHTTDTVEALIHQMSEESKASKATEAAKEDNSVLATGAGEASHEGDSFVETPTLIETDNASNTTEAAKEDNSVLDTEAAEASHEGDPFVETPTFIETNNGVNGQVA